MFEHVWRRTRETFYTAGYHGVDWDGLKPIYQKYLPHVGNNYEFAEVLSEMLGELNVSHSGASFASSASNPDATASLGLFYDQMYTGAGVRVAEVIKDGPSNKAGMNVCYAYTYKALNLGQLVGMPVPGTCTFAGWEPLVDGLRWGVPPVGVKDVNGKYLENAQTEPDIKVMNTYDVVITGKDEQLEAAVAALMRTVGGR